MSSSDRRRAAGEARVAAEAALAAAVTGGENGAADGAELDPWFGAGPKVLPAADPAEPPTAASGEAQAELDARAEWFLPAGRAGLMPESMTVSEDEDQSGAPRAEYPAQMEAVGAPPWAGETTGPAAGMPPPWETGPWPGPGADGASLTARGRAPDGSAAASPAPAGPAAGQSRAGQRPASALGSARTVLAVGLVPLVIPGLIAGALGFRRSRPGEPVRRASVLAIAASLAWAVIIVVVLVASTSGGSAGSCQYPAAAHQAYARAMADLSSNAKPSVMIADLGLAASRANASAAATATGDVTVRSVLFAMTADLQQARADLVANRPVPGQLRAHLAADETALRAACPS
jgi:hypothetical protein